MTAWASHQISVNANEQAAQEFDRLASRVESDVIRRFDLPIYGLKSVGSLVLGSEHVSREEFRHVIATLDVAQRFKGVRGFGYIERVRGQDLPAFIQRERADNAPDFDVRTQGQSPDLHVIKLIEPLEANRAAVGFDVGSEPIRRQAIEHAIDTGKPTLTRRITLLQDQQKRPGLLMLMPTYRAGYPLGTAAQRQQALIGTVFSPIVLAEILYDLPEAVSGRLDIAIREEPLNDTAHHGETASTSYESLFEFVNQRASKNVPMFSRSRTISVGERQWMLDIRSNSEFDRHVDHSTSSIIAVGGGVLTLLLSMIIWLLGSRQSKAEALAASMTKDLDRLAKFVRYTSHAVILMDQHSVITWVNEGFSRLYGYTLDEAIGKTMGDLVGTSRTAPESIQALQHAAEMGQSCRVEVVNRAKDGRDYWIETEVLPTLDTQGKVTGFIELAQNVTALKEALLAQEAALREKQSLLHTINVHTIVSVADAKGIITDANEAFCQVSGYTRQELIGQDHRIVDAKYHPRAFWIDMWRSIAQGRPWRGEICNKAKNGQLYWVDSIIAPFVGADGRIEKYISIRTDITHRKLVEQKLRDSQALLDRAGRIAGIGGWQYDIASRKPIWSDQNCRLFDRPPGYTPDEADLLSHLTDEGKKLIGEAARRALAEGTSWDLEVQACTATGRHIWVRSIGEPEFEDGKLVRLVGATQDITQQRAARHELTRTSTLLRNVLDAASEVSIIAADANLLITVFNSGAERLLGYQSEEMIGKQTPAVFHDAEEVKLRALALSDQTGEVITGPEVFTRPEGHGKPADWTYIRKDQSRVRVSLVVTPQHDAKGQLVGYLGIAHDITMRLRYESSLRQAMMQAEQANLAKSQFLANMSHEIRTPMNAILGMLKLLSKTPLTARQLDYTSKTEGAARSLLALLNDILDFSKVEAGKMALDLHAFQLEALLQNMAVILSASIGDKPVEILFDIDPDIPPTLMGDDLRLQQILINLGGNAIKFTHEGEVVLGMHMLALNQEQVTLRVSVTDTGIGIAPAALTQIFEGFQQAESSTTRRFGGTGLGLAISKRLVEMMGGNLIVNSELGKGSEFWFEITLGVATDAGSPEPARPLRALTVDDNASARRILQAQARSLGWTCDTAENGQHAIELIQAALREGGGMRRCSLTGACPAWMAGKPAPESGK